MRALQFLAADEPEGLGYQCLGDWQRNSNVDVQRQSDWLASQGYDEKITVWLIDWENPRSTDFAVAEEVTVAGPSEKRPGIVLYVNGWC